PEYPGRSVGLWPWRGSPHLNAQKQQSVTRLFLPATYKCRFRNSPGFVRCPHCLELVTSNVAYVAGRTAVCSCADLTVLCFRLFCGFCLIPLCMRGLQDAHHSCPQCGEKLYVYER
uniref:LITAF domain-containing protein n=1 Tax=Xiphophorus couchianus TaxID=32473 RepID=A0A3B5L4E1_9TELE